MSKHFIRITIIFLTVSLHSYSQDSCKTEDRFLRLLVWYADIISFPSTFQDTIVSGTFRFEIKKLFKGEFRGKYISITTSSLHIKNGKALKQDYWWFLEKTEKSSINSIVYKHVGYF